MSNDSPTEIEGEYLTRTILAVRLRVDLGNRRVVVWIPRSQLLASEPSLMELEDGDMVTLTIPQWMAEDKGLV